MRKFLIAAQMIAAGFPAYAHDYWANGVDVPDWVKSVCCGKADANRLRPEQIHQTENSIGKPVYRVTLDDGRVIDVPWDRALPSQDGNYWLFCDHNPTPQIYCFFAPMGM